MLNIMNKQEAQSKFALAARQKKTADGPGKKKRAARGKKKLEPATGVADLEAEAPFEF